jgi:putative membrane protein
MERADPNSPPSPADPVPIPLHDPRVYLANERTLLAWIRTGLAMMGFGFLVAKFGLFVSETAAARGGRVPEWPRFSLWLGTAMVLLSVALTLVAGIEHLRLARRMWTSDFGGARFAMGVATILTLALLGLVMVAYLLTL